MSTSAQSTTFSRRSLLNQWCLGFGGLALNSMLAQPSFANPSENPLSPQKGHFKPRAKRIIFLFMHGGPSHVDLFDPKPALTKFDGKEPPFERTRVKFGKRGNLLKSPWQFRPTGKSGIPMSSLWQNLPEVADDLCMLHGLCDTNVAHGGACMKLFTGSESLIRPSIGSWVSYGLGTENQNLPGFVTLCPGLPVADFSNWRSSFLPGVYQGTYLDTRKKEVESLVANIRNKTLPLDAQRQQLNLLAKLNRRHRETRKEDPFLEARIASFELAFRMQLEATDALDLSNETRTTHTLYGTDKIHGRQMLMARRLIERGVRVVQCYHGDVQPWDSHEGLAGAHAKLGREADGPIAALLTDLAQRGLLDETLVICGGEFGRTPAVEIPLGANRKPTGRDHNHHGYTVWMAGGGTRGGMTYGTTDDFGYRAVDKPVHVHDLHATMLHLMGFDHEELTYHHAGRDFRLTDVHGRVLNELLA